jgi:ribonuclease HI
MPKKKFYVVWSGRTQGIFDTWDQCQAQVEGFPGAEYKSFDTLQQAEEATKKLYAEYVVPATEEPVALSEDDLRRIGRPIAESYAVDAACSGNPGLMEYRCVHTTKRNEVFRVGPFKDGTSNVGEFLAIVHALALFKRKGIAVPIYSDSEIAIDWVEGRKCRTKLQPTERNAELLPLIGRAEEWLLNNAYQNRVLKWWTKLWGEIPADFGRK